MADCVVRVIGSTRPPASEPDIATWTARPAVGVADLAAAVRQARELARPGDVVLLSPACASYDMFPNFQHRGNTFRNLVLQL